MKRKSNILAQIRNIISLFFVYFSEIEFEGFKLPKNTWVIPHLYAIHMNPENFPEPEKFRPERFINEEGKAFKPSNFLPFGYGQRTCIGDKLAEKEFFLIFTSLLQCFNIEAEDSQSEAPSLQAVSGATLAPKPFKMVCSPRYENCAAYIPILKSGKPMLKQSQSSSVLRTFGL